MKRARGWAVLLGVLVCTPAALSQIFVAPAPYVAGYSTGGFGIGFSRHGHHGHLSLFATGGSGYYSYGYPYYPVGVSRLTFVQVVTPPPIVIEPPPRIEVRLPVEIARAPLRPQPEQVVPPNEKQPGEGGFRPVRPPDVPRVPPPPKVPEVPPVKPPPKEKPPEKPVPAEKPKEQPPPPAPKPPRPPQPDSDPRAESARQVALGRDAFAAGEYGRAAQRFRQAVRVNPNDALAYFLLAQAEVALGKYDQAVEAIHAGLRIDPNWPSVPFRPVNLYGDNVTDLPEHLRALEDALARHPDDPVLLFLSAYELWFDGRQDEARPLFQRAAAVAPDPSFSERFLLARPDEPAL
jgi:hypothetical protein